MTEDIAKPSSIWNDRYLAYIPLAGAAVALTYDVRYFSRLDISFFTLFSLSEHILFAIQAFPIALAVILISFGVAGIILNVPPWPSPPAPVNPKKLHRAQLIAAIFLLVILLLIPLSFIGYMLYSTPIVTPLAMEVLLGLGGLVFIPDPYKRAFIAAAAVLFVLTSSFFVGYLFAASAITIADPNNAFQLGIETIDFKNGKYPSINGRIIRSGERGVLLYDTGSHRLRFLLWEDIGAIEGTPHSMFP